MSEKKNMELCSEKVRSVMGKMPSLLLRIGILVVTIVICIIFALMYYIPYPQIQKFEVNIESNNLECLAKVELKVKDATFIRVGQKISLQIFTIGNTYLVNGYVLDIKEYKGKAIIALQLSPLSGKISKYLYTRPSGELTVYLSRTSILKRILKKQ